MKTILATAYAINPSKGSEDGMGWNFILQIARYNRVIAITRKNNRDAIEKYMNAFPSDIYSRIEFLYFDLPDWVLKWKKKTGAAMLYYQLWQKMIPSFITAQNLHFDIAHNLNFHNDWTPSWLWKTGKPFVWGPIGHHPAIPRPYLQDYSWMAKSKDLLTTLLKKYFWQLSPALQKTKEKASHILCMNSSVPKVLRLQKDQYTLMPSVACEDNDFEIEDKMTPEKFTLLSAGRLVPLKGFDLAIKAFAHFIHQLPENEKMSPTLVIAGSGPEKDNYVRLTQVLQIASNVEFIEWLPRTELMKRYEDASAFLFPSHEGAGMVVAEALSYCLPVICLDNNGPGEFIEPHCGIAIKHQSYEDTVIALSVAIHKLYSHPALQKMMGYMARDRYEQVFRWDLRGDALAKIYDTL